MESKINYTLVGLFVVLLTAGLISFAYWLGKHGGRQEYDAYLVYMSESVAGLSTDASVKYRGVNVGTVERLGINPHNAKEVEILLKIEHGTPIKTDTTATLKSFGITGLAFIELSGGSNDAPPLQKTGDSIPIIPATPSTFTQIYGSLEQLIQQSASTLIKFDQILSKENLENITAILGETKLLVKDIRGQMAGLQNLVESGVVMEKQVSSAFEKVAHASDSVKKMADSLEHNYANVGHEMQQDVRQSLELFNQLLYDLDILTGDLQHATQAIQASPSDLLFKHRPLKPGPGEREYNEK
ncbi:MlaD family protein [Desulfopila sp. IMCC35006]|uniref:MlaD family protein n=1 Tax=Desulfopila sp. IMCC35006 TaxID=2569542 RepID=UPI00142EF5F2|nr:MlaD family protein [Desulfopila sp. IMCC35006]